VKGSERPSPDLHLNEFGGKPLAVRTAAYPDSGRSLSLANDAKAPFEHRSFLKVAVLSIRVNNLYKGLTWFNRTRIHSNMSRHGDREALR